MSAKDCLVLVDTPGVASYDDASREGSAIECEAGRRNNSLQRRPDRWVDPQGLLERCREIGESMDIFPGG